MRPAVAANPLFQPTAFGGGLTPTLGRMKSVFRSVPRWLLLLAPLLLAPVAAAQSDAQIRATLVGLWQETRHVDCEEHRQRMDLRTDGTFEVAGFIGACNGLSAFVWRGTWKVVSRRFVYTTTSSNPPELYPKGQTFSDEVISVTGESWEMLEQSTGNKSIAKRVK